MFTTKILQKMAPHGLTFGEHCVDLEKNCKDVEPLEKQMYSGINTMFMRNAGCQPDFCMYRNQAERKSEEIFTVRTSG
jgi:hypothetical protein